MRTKITDDLTKKLLQTIQKRGVFSCPEVTIGWYGKERVDYLTYDTNDIFRCYEIKSCKEDFYSKSKHTFVGNYNYYVMPMDVYEMVKDDIPNHIGVYTNSENKRIRKLYSVKSAKKQELSVDKEILKNSLIRSLHRDSMKYRKGR